MLLVEDHPAIAFALEDYFRARGWQVASAASRPEAERVLEDRRFTLVIADLSLSDPGSIDGLELTRRIRSEWPRTRTIILTAYGSEEIEQAARGVGVDAFLQKPAALRELARLAEELAAR